MNTEETIQWFETWSGIKISIHTNTEEPVYFREKEIWWTALGANVGFEQNGKNESYERPVVIIKKFNKDFFLGIPLTSKTKTGSYYFCLDVVGEQSSAILSQVRPMSSKRLLRKMSLVPTEAFKVLKERLRRMI
jgi:mRNA interferase MazF